MSNLLKQALTALEKAREAVEDWSKYASEYFQSKHGIDADLASIDTEIAALRTAIEQAEQAQPRAWEYTATLTSGGYSSPFKERRLAFTKPEQGGPIPLYTHSQPSKPLSYEQIGKLVDTYIGGPSPSYPLDQSSWIDFTRAVESEHGIKEQS